MTDRHDMPDDSVGSNIIANWRTARWELPGRTKRKYEGQARAALLMLRGADIRVLLLKASDPDSGMCRNPEEAKEFRDWVKHIFLMGCYGGYSNE